MSNPDQEYVADLSKVNEDSIPEPEKVRFFFSTA